MKISRIDAFAITARNPSRQAYWGSAAWGQSSALNLQSRTRWGATRFPSPARVLPVYSETIDTTIVRIETDDGIIGWGEAKAPVAPTVCKAIVEHLLAPMVIGQDPFDKEVIWETLYASMRLRGHDSGFLLEAISGIDIALWDIVGKATGQPIHRLLGGAYRNDILVYASGVPATSSQPDQPDWRRMLDGARSAQTRGFRGLKMAIGLSSEADLRSVAAVRKELGPEFAIFVDAAGNYDVPTATEVAEGLQALGVGFFEAPLPHEHIHGYAELRKSVRIPIANDVLTSRYQVRDYLAAGALDIAQPDVCRTGGITELARIATLTDTFGIGFTPHVSIGSAIHFAASFHLAAAAPNLIQMEYWFGENPLGDAILTRPALSVKDGFVRVPTGPGLGIDIDEEKLLTHTAGG